MNRLSLENGLRAFTESLDDDDHMAFAYYDKVSKKLLLLQGDHDIKSLLDAILASSRIKDAYGLSLSQTKLWDELWEIALEYRQKL